MPLTSYSSLFLGHSFHALCLWFQGLDFRRCVLLIIIIIIRLNCSSSFIHCNNFFLIHLCNLFFTFNRNGYTFFHWSSFHAIDTSYGRMGIVYTFSSSIHYLLLQKEATGLIWTTCNLHTSLCLLWMIQRIVRWRIITVLIKLATTLQWLYCWKETKRVTNMRMISREIH